MKYRKSQGHFPIQWITLVGFILFELYAIHFMRQFFQSVFNVVFSVVFTLGYGVWSIYELNYNDVVEKTPQSNNIPPTNKNTEEW